MQNKLLHPKQTASLPGVSEALLAHDRCLGQGYLPNGHPLNGRPPLGTCPMTTEQEIYRQKRGLGDPLIGTPLIEGVPFHFFESSAH
jgi:hypothetical protein